MKRALAFAFAALLFGVAGLAQISGTWVGKVQILPSPSLSYTVLKLTYSVAGFDLTSKSKFYSTGWADQSFGLKGAVGPVNIEGTMGFNPTVPAYAYADLSGSLDFAGLSITGKVFHGVYPYGESYFDDTYYPYTFAGVYKDACEQTVQTDDVLMFYTFETTVEPLSITAHFVDCCTGIEFYDVSISLSDLSLCCGITYDITVKFTKAGFQYIDFYVDHLFDLCCGISFGMDVLFTVNSKTVTPIISWGGIEGCVTVWGDVIQTQGTIIEGWELYGYKLSCELAECNSIEFLTAFRPDLFYVDSAGNIVVNPSNPSLYYPLFNGNEFEYIKATVCGPACCGGNWSLSATAFFDNKGGLFGVDRFKISAAVPITDAFTLKVYWTYDPSLGGGPNYFALGWTFTF